MSLIEGVRRWVLAALPYNKADSALDAHLKSLDARGLLIVYHNWMSRLIKPELRAIHRSKAYVDNPVRQQVLTELTQMEGEIERGADLRKYLSRGVDIAADLPGKKLGKRRDLDMMLTMQQVHHLHISIMMDADGYVQRASHLLFAVFKPRAAYLIDIMAHGDWTRDHVLEVMNTEWPNAGLATAMQGVLGLRHNYTEDERAKLQKAGVNTLVDLGGGRIVMPGGMATAAGTSFNASRTADQVVEQIGAFEKRYATDHKKMRRLFERSGHSFPSGKPHYEFSIEPEGVGVIETTSKIFVPFKNLDLGA